MGAFSLNLRERGERRANTGSSGAPFPLLSPPFPVPVKEERWDFLGPFAKKDAAAAVAGAFVAAVSWEAQCLWRVTGH